MKTEMLSQRATSFLQTNYNYIWLKTRLEKGTHVRDKGTLITGSSHALNEIDTSFWNNAVNCSMHSQDIYYDYLCARHVIGERTSYARCFIILGYYIAYQDLSRSLLSRENYITKVYYPIFHDAHHWESPTAYDIWTGFEDLSDKEKFICEEMAIKILSGKEYYSFRRRLPFFDFDGKTWPLLTQEERYAYGEKRAEAHNKHIKYVESLAENTELLRDYIHYLALHNVLPIVVVTPFSKEYNQFINPDMKAALYDMLNSIKDEVHFIDFNETDFFDENDFIDTDHLNANGAQKVCSMLVELFGR